MSAVISGALPVSYPDYMEPLVALGQINLHSSIFEEVSKVFWP